MKDKGLSNLVYETTGLTIDPYFSGTKIRWILDNVPGAYQMARRGELAFGTVDSWLIWNLSNGASHITDVSNASRTMLYDIRKSQWSSEMLEVMDIPVSMLPEVVPSSGNLASVAGNHFAGQSIPICGIVGDQQSALFGQCCFNPGMIKVTYGTGAFLLMNTGKEIVRSKEGLLTTVAWEIDGEVTYALEGGVFSAGSAVQWLRDEMNLISSADEIETLAQTVEDNGGVYFVPAFNGLGTPYWDPFARGSIQGLTMGSNKGHLARAIIESIAYQSNEVLSLMFLEANRPITSLRADGGASSNDLLMQFQADISGFSVNRAYSLETTSLGAAFLAGLGIGLWNNQQEIDYLWRTGGDFIPRLGQDLRNNLKNHWQKAAQRSLQWTE
jgi:glycerol kinase